MPMFRCEQIESGKLAKEWLEWKGALEIYFESYQITDQRLKRSKMLHLGGPQLQKVFRSLDGTENFPIVLLEKPWYDVAVERLDAYFKPRRQDVLERYKLRNMKQGTNERFSHFVLRLRQQLLDCGLEKYPQDFRTSVEEMMLIDVIVEGCTSPELRRKILEKDQCLSDIEALGNSMESVRAQEQEMTKHPRDSTGEVEVRKVDKFSVGRADRKQERIVKRFVGRPSPYGTVSKVVCYACGKSGHISRDTACPAKGQKCRRCQTLGHFEKACRKRSSTSQDNFVARKIRAVSNESASISTEKDISTDEVEQKVYYTFHTGNEANLMQCEVGGVSIEMIIDSGSDVNLISAGTWETMKAKRVVLQRCTKGGNKILKAYGTDKPLEILGSFEAVVKLGRRSASAEFFVIKTGQRNILGDTTSKQLGVLRVGVDVNQVHHSSPIPFPKIKGVQVRIKMDPTVVPVFQPLRRIPIPLEDAVNRKLDELLAKDIIEPKKGPATWVSPLVVAKKANGEIRLCVDLRRVNQAVIRERHPMPIIEDVLAKIGRGNVWSTLDIKDAFFLLELDEESRSVTTFISHRGLYQFKRLPFGLVSAPEMFQPTMDGILADCEGAYWYLDDVGVEGSTVEEHDTRLSKV